MISRKSRLALAELYAKAFGIPDHTIPSWVWADLDNEELFDFLFTNGYPEQFYEAIRKKKYPDEIRKFLLSFEIGVASRSDTVTNELLIKLAEDIFLEFMRLDPNAYWVQNSAEEQSKLLSHLDEDGYVYHEGKFLLRMSSASEPTSVVVESPVCPKCKVVLRGGAKFCDNCGTRIYE